MGIYLHISVCYSDGQASKTPRGTSIGKGKTATTAASGSRAKQPSTAPKRPLPGAAAVKRRTELGASLRTKPNPPSSEILMLMGMSLQLCVIYM